VTKVRVWLSHDGYRDPDDNLGLLVGSAQARVSARGSADLSVGGFVYGDTIDGGQFHMLNPTGETPAAFDGDPRFDDIAKNKVAAGNYAFYANYGAKAIAGLGPGWDRFDLIAEDPTGLKAWTYAPAGRAQMTKAAWELAADIRAAVGKGGGAAPNEVVVYSAGGGAHVAAEAIGYLRGQGFDEATLVRHFAVAQHGRSNWWLNQEPEATAITRPYTIALSEQDPDVYANGMNAPGLKLLVRNGVWLEGDGFGSAFARATAVAQGLEPFMNLGGNKTFKPTKDGSDAGSHAFAADAAALLAAWDDRMRPGEDLPYRTKAEHLVENGAATRLRVIYDEFDWRDARALMNGGAAAAVPGPADPEPGSGAVAIAGASLTAFGLDGSAAAVGSAGGRFGVADAGDAATVDRAGARSERLVVELDAAADSIVISLLGLSGRDGFREAARVVAHDEAGAVLASRTLVANGAHELRFDAPVHSLSLAADAWRGTGEPPAGDPDFSLVGIDIL
jgi:hypothetical protein